MRIWLVQSKLFQKVACVTTKKGVDLEGLQGRVGISMIKKTTLYDLLKELIKLYLKNTMGGLAQWVRGLAV